MSSDTALPSRERCQCCNRYSAVGFWVPNRVWDRVVPNQFHESPLCVACFADMGDERMIAWDQEIQFFPVSLATHHDVVSPKCNGENHE